MDNTLSKIGIESYGSSIFLVSTLASITYILM